MMLEFDALLTMNLHWSGWKSLCWRYSLVVYQPRKIGRKEMAVGASQAVRIIIEAVRTVMVMWYCCHI